MNMSQNIRNINTEKLKEEYDKFKSSEDYDKRKNQLKFRNIANLILKEVLKKRSITNNHLTALIQMFGYNCKQENFEKYLKILKLSNESRILKLYNKTNEQGFTGRGKAIIEKANTEQLKNIRIFLLTIEKTNSVKKIKDAIEKYQKFKIPEVKEGIYSPWLYYLKPTICPLVAAHVRNEFLPKIGLKKSDYSSAIDVFQSLNEIIGEKDLGYIDAFLWEKNRRVKIYENSEKISNQTNNISIDKNKLNIILYGPPGTGKTFTTKRMAIDILGVNNE